MTTITEEPVTISDIINTIRELPRDAGTDLSRWDLYEETLRLLRCEFYRDVNASVAEVLAQKADDLEDEMDAYEVLEEVEDVIEHQVELSEWVIYPHRALILAHQLGNYSNEAESNLLDRGEGSFEDLDVYVCDLAREVYRLALREFIYEAWNAKTEGVV